MTAPKFAVIYWDELIDLTAPQIRLLAAYRQFAGRGSISPRVNGSCWVSDAVLAKLLGYSDPRCIRRLRAQLAAANIIRVDGDKVYPWHCNPDDPARSKRWVQIYVAEIWDASLPTNAIPLLLAMRLRDLANGDDSIYALARQLKISRWTAARIYNELVSLGRVTDGRLVDVAEIYAATLLTNPNYRGGMADDEIQALRSTRTAVRLAPAPARGSKSVRGSGQKCTILVANWSGVSEQKCPALVHFGPERRAISANKIMEGLKKPPWRALRTIVSN